MKRERSTHAQQNVRERDRYSLSVLVGAGIMHSARTSRHMFELGRVTYQCHFTEIILDHVRLFKGIVGPDFLYMEDNGRPHRSAEASDTLESEDVNSM